MNTTKLQTVEAIEDRIAIVKHSKTPSWEYVKLPEHDTKIFREVNLPTKMRSYARTAVFEMQRERKSSENAIVRVNSGV